MSMEEKTINDLAKKFPSLSDSLKVQRDRRIWAEAEYPRFREVFEYITKQLGFSFLCTITGIDAGEKLGLIYHLASENGTVLNLRTCVPMPNPVFKSITDSFANAEIYEREIMDLLGATVEGLAPSFRYPLTDDWPSDQFPLRKSWKQEGAKIVGA